jgi:hypothetical protein
MIAKGPGCRIRPGNPASHLPLTSGNDINATLMSP